LEGDGKGLLTFVLFASILKHQQSGRFILKAIALFILASSYFVTAGAQPNPDTLWTRTYGGSSSAWAWCVQQTTDGGFVVAGRTYSFGAWSGDIYLVKADSQGDTLWSRTYGGSSGDWAYSVQETTDGGYIVAGYATSTGANGEDFYFVKTNNHGDTLWTRSYGGGNNDEAYSVQQTADEGYISAGWTYSFGAGDSDFYLVKLNSQGNILWTRTYGGYSADNARSVQQTSDEGYILAGNTWSFGAGNDDFYLVKTNSQGDTLWTRTYGGSSWDHATSVRQTFDGGYIIAGSTQSFGAGYDDFYLVKTDDQGDTLWTRSYGGDLFDYAYSVQQTADGGYVVAGYSCSFGTFDYDFYLVKTNSQGDTLWTRRYGGSDDDDAFCVQQTTDGGYVIGGHTYASNEGINKFYVVKTGPESQGSEQIEMSTPEQYAVYPNFPNPFNASTQIVYELPKTGRVSLSVFNLLGEEVTNLVAGVQAGGRHSVVFDGSGLASGVYLYRLQANGFVQARKMVLMK
jgi:uncharacterized delta-60 repeat protein